MHKFRDNLAAKQAELDAKEAELVAVKLEAKVKVEPQEVPQVHRHSQCGRRAFDSPLAHAGAGLRGPLEAPG